MKISEIICALKNNPNFEVKEPCGLPTVNNGHYLPKDVKEFYSLCGGVSFYIEDGGFPIEVLSPDKVVHANSLLIGEAFEDDISFSWYVIADAEDGNYISIDCEKKRLGQCYESFEYSHAVKGCCPIIAKTFTELLYNLFVYDGDYFYWKDNPEFTVHGDAYERE